MDRNESAPRQAEAGFGDDQGTRVGAPDQERMEPGQHSDAPTGRPERTTGVGGEATEGTPKTSEGHEREHRSGYGGAGGAPVNSSDTREPPRR
jgi:hypothetical protein